MYIDGTYQTERQIEVGNTPYSKRYMRDYKIALDRLVLICEHRREGAAGHRDNGKLLDIGCSNGAFVHAAGIVGYFARGMDLYVRTGDIEHCFSKPMADFYGGQGYAGIWDVVTMHDLVEHFVDPKAEIGHVHRILKPDGLAVIQTPDFGCVEFKEQAIKWKHVRPVEHLYMMPPEMLVGIMEDTGFRVVGEDRPIPGQFVVYAKKGDETWL